MLILTVSLLLILMGMSLLKEGRSFLRERYRFLFGTVVGTYVAVAIYLSFAQYQAMLLDPVAQYLLPPHRGISYFIVWIATFRIFGPYVLSFLVSLLFLGVAKHFNRQHDERFFEKDEIQVGALAIFLVGHPGWILFIPIFFVAYLVFQVYYQVRHGAGHRLPAYYLWVPTALFVILVSEYLLSEHPLWLVLKLS